MSKYTSIYGHHDLLRMISDIQPGTYLFYGAVSIGKRTVAFETARYGLCLDIPGDSCKCHSCVQFQQGSHPDFLCIGRTDKVRVLDVDRLLEFLSKMPFLSKRKIAVIDNIHNMTYEASNRLLKVLEEPPEGFSFFLITHDITQVFDTVLSRCIRYRFGSLSQEDLTNVIWKKMGFELSEARVLSWISCKSSIDVFSQAGTCIKCRDRALRLITIARHGDLIEIMDFIDKIDRVDYPVLIDMTMLLLTDLLFIQEGVGIVNADLKESLEKLSKSFNSKALVAATSIFSQAKKNMYLNVNLGIVLKNIMIKTQPMFTA